MLNLLQQIHPHCQALTCQNFCRHELLFSKYSEGSLKRHLPKPESVKSKDAAEHEVLPLQESEKKRSKMDTADSSRGDPVNVDSNKDSKALAALPVVNGTESAADSPTTLLNGSASKIKEPWIKGMSSKGLPSSNQETKDLTQPDPQDPTSSSLNGSLENGRHAISIPISATADQEDLPAAVAREYVPEGVMPATTQPLDGPELILEGLEPEEAAVAMDAVDNGQPAQAAVEQPEGRTKPGLQGIHIDLTKRSTDDSPAWYCLVPLLRPEESTVEVSHRCTTLPLMFLKAQPW